MEQSPNLSLPYIMPAQAQKHVTHNEAIRMLDALVQLTVLDRDLTSPPTTPTEGVRYIIASGSTGDWLGRDDQIAAYQDGAWAYFPPQPGYLAWLDDEAELLVWDGTTWMTASGSGGGGGSISLNPADGGLIGINATADTTNRLSLNAPASLFNHDGSDHQLKINKNMVADTASVLFQTGYSGRAEFGLTGDDDFHMKVSPDGTTFHEGIVIDSTTGSVTFPNSHLANENLLINGAFAINQRQFSGGTLAAGDYGFDRWKALTEANLSVTGATVTFASGQIAQVIEPELWELGSLASTQLTLSVEELSGGNLDITIGSVSNTISAGSGRRKITITTNTSDTGNLTVILEPSSSAVSFKRVKLETGNTATRWQSRGLQGEIQLSKRYYRSSYSPGIAPGAADRAGSVGFHTPSTNSYHYIADQSWETAMRASPTITGFNPDTGSTVTPVRNTSNSTNHPATIDQIGPNGFFAYVNNSSINGGQRILMHFVAEAEL